MDRKFLLVIEKFSSIEKKINRSLFDFLKKNVLAISLFLATAFKLVQMPYSISSISKNILVTFVSLLLINDAIEEKNKVRR